MTNFRIALWMMTANHRILCGYDFRYMNENLISVCVCVKWMNIIAIQYSWWINQYSSLAARKFSILLNSHGESGIHPLGDQTRSNALCNSAKFNAKYRISGKAIRMPSSDAIHLICVRRLYAFKIRTTFYRNRSMTNQSKHKCDTCYSYRIFSICQHCEWQPWTIRHTRRCNAVTFFILSLYISHLHGLTSHVVCNWIQSICMVSIPTNLTESNFVRAKKKNQRKNVD